MATLRNEPVQQRARDTLDSIMHAADALFAERGVGDTTNSLIAEQAGVSIGTLYRFFPNKSALVTEYLDRYLDALVSRVPSEIPESPSLDDLDEIVGQLVERSLATQRQFRGYGRVRQWRYPETGVAASQRVREAELAFVRGLIAASPYELDAERLELVTIVIVDSTWPLIEEATRLPKRKQAALVQEIERHISSYIRSVVVAPEAVAV